MALAMASPCKPPGWSRCGSVTLHMHAHADRACMMIRRLGAWDGPASALGAPLCKVCDICLPCGQMLAMFQPKFQSQACMQSSIILA